MPAARGVCARACVPLCVRMSSHNVLQTLPRLICEEELIGVGLMETKLHPPVSSVVHRKLEQLQLNQSLRFYTENNPQQVHLLLSPSKLIHLLHCSIKAKCSNNFKTKALLNQREIKIKQNSLCVGSL